MLIGNGMMARQFAKYQYNNDILIFASGVSNSKETRDSEFERELNLLQRTIAHNSEKHFVYFGTSSMYDPMAKHSPYVLHKLDMERYVVENCKSYNIFRISQVIGRANNPTLVNFIIENIINDREFDVWERATRNLIALNDVFLIVNYILVNKLLSHKIINIANKENISIINFIRIVEQVIGKKAKIRVSHKGYPFDKIDIAEINSVVKELHIHFDDDSYYFNAVKQILFGDDI
ncbi:MAG: NAD-dependent epimerase/dehydratase family protein [Burkholderiales bacterium]|nr:NAD-dependent epimerase/dehydratase family protein [Burkholderiales bacterium]